MLAKVIRDSEHEHHVISLKPRGVIADEMLGSTYYVGWKVWKIYKLVNYLSPDVLMTWLYHSDLIGLILGRLAGVPRIIWNIRCSDMNYRIWNYQWWLRKLCALLSDIPTMIVINSMQSKEFHKQIGYNPTIWKVIPNGFDTDEFKPYLRAKKRLKDYLGLKGDVKLIGMVARNHPMKDYRTFIRAAVQILNTRKDVHFVMAGKDVGNDTVETNFHTLGERHDMHLIYPAFDVLCMTSAYGEGFPNVVGEAMASGVPCVVTDVGDARFLVGDTGYVTEPKDSKDIAKGVIQLLKHGKGIFARSRIKKWFNIKEIRKEYEECYG